MDSVHSVDHPTSTRQPTPPGPEAAARRVERWALVAGVTGCTANGLLLALYAVALPGNSGYDWTGPANDVVGAAAALSMIPMTAGVRDLIGSPGRLPLLTRAVALGGAASATASGLLVLGVIDLPVQVAVWALWFAAVAGWQRSIAHWGADSGRLPHRLGRASAVVENIALAGLAVAGIAAALPWGSPAQLVVGTAAAAAAAGAYFALPVWQLALSRAMSRRPLEGARSSVVAR